MNYDILKTYMKSFSSESLKSYLGDDLVESLLEWHTGNEGFLTKNRMIEMILSIYGINILQQKDFRLELLKRVPKEKVLDFRFLLPKKYSNSEDVLEIAEVVTNTSWRENQINEQFLRLFDYDSKDIFEQKKEEIIAKEQIESNDKFYELLDYQYIIRQKALNILKSEYGLQRFLIHMPTGTGKTKTATHIICHHYNYNLSKTGLIVWVAHTTELLKQAYDTFVSVWKNIGNGKITTYKLWGNYDIELIDEEMNGFMVCGIQKLQAMSKSNPKLLEKIIHDTRLLVYDEAHKASATETKNIINQFMTRKEDMPNRALMGLSATPGRTTELSFDNDILVSMFGNKIISIDTKLMNAVNLSAQEAAIQ